MVRAGSGESKYRMLKAVTDLANVKAEDPLLEMTTQIPSKKLAKLDWNPGSLPAVIQRSD